MLFQITTKVQVVFDSVCLKLNLVEKDYFGLCYYDNNSIKVSDTLKVVACICL